MCFSFSCHHQISLWGVPNEQVWTSLQCSPLDVTSGVGVGVPGLMPRGRGNYWPFLGRVTYHVTYPMMHSMLPPCGQRYLRAVMIIELFLFEIISHTWHTNEHNNVLTSSTTIHPGWNKSSLRYEASPNNCNLRGCTADISVPEVWVVWQMSRWSF